MKSPGTGFHRVELVGLKEKSFLGLFDSLIIIKKHIQTTEGGGCHGNILTCHVSAREFEEKYLSNGHEVSKLRIEKSISFCLKPVLH